VDGVFIQSAWHWLDPDRAIGEIARVMMTVDDFLGMLATYSRIITADPAGWAAENERARAYLAQRFPGADRLEVPLQAWAWRAKLRP
jgi:hypothetical protein